MKRVELCRGSHLSRSRFEIKARDDFNDSSQFSETKLQSFGDIQLLVNKTFQQPP